MAKIDRIKKTLSISESSSIEHLETHLPSLPFATEVSENQGDEVLSDLLFKKGELYLLNGDLSGLYFFEMGSKLEPENPTLYYRQGFALLEFGSKQKKEEGLKLACKRFKQATILNPNYFEAWHQWGYALYLLGNSKKEPSYFLGAKQKYERSFKLKENQSVDTIADLYGHQGDLWVVIADRSGEPSDLAFALKSYAQATTYREQHSFDFWLRYGRAALKLGKKTSQLTFFVESIVCYKNALTVSVGSSKGWQYLGEAIHALYCLTHDNDHYSQANECFKIAAKLSLKDPRLWYEWASLLFDGAAYHQDKAKLRLCIEKCYRGSQLGRNYSPLLALWAEALALLGSSTEQLELIDEAHNKVQELSAGRGHEKDVLYLEGKIAMAFGCYFQDPDYYYQGAEKFQEILSRDRTDSRMWHMLGKSYLLAAELDGDESSLKYACRFFKRAIHLLSKPVYHCDYGSCLVKYGELTQNIELIKQGLEHVKSAIDHENNAFYMRPDWLFSYAYALDIMGTFSDAESYYIKAIDTLLHILSLQPDFKGIHYQLALTYGHYAQFTSNCELFNRSFHYYQISSIRDKENDQMILDWGIALANFGDICGDSTQAAHYLRKAEYKMIQAARLGNVHAYYSLACLYSLMGHLDQAMHFLEKGERFEGLPSIEEMVEDEWLENCRDTPRFQTLLNRLKDNVNE